MVDRVFCRWTARLLRGYLGTYQGVSKHLPKCFQLVAKMFVSVFMMY